MHGPEQDGVFEVEGPVPRGFVYIVRSVETGTCYLGAAADEANGQAKVGTMPFPVTFICALPSPDPEKSRLRIKAFFAHKRLAGDWYALSAQDLGFLKSIMSFREDEA